MEEQRIGMMYLNLLKSRLSRLRYSIFGGGKRRSSFLPWLILLVFVIPILGYTLHTHAKFHKLKSDIKGAPPPPAVPKPGGEEALKLTRNETPGNNLPEFLSATLLPGLGMDVLQISAFLPGHGEINLLEAPTVDQMASGTLADRAGANDDQGAIELPWSGSLPGSLSPLGTTVSTYWKGRALELPVIGTAGRAVAEGGLLTGESADVNSSERGDTQVATGTFHDTDFSGRWPSHTDVTVSLQLAARTVDIVVTARNTGSEPEPMGIGWHPRFTIPSGNRDGAELKLPNGEVLEVADRVRNLPTGKIEEITNSLSRLQGHAGQIGPGGLDAGLVHLKPGVMDTGAAVELRDPESRFGLRLTAQSTSIRELRVLSPTGARYVGIGMQTNLDDPLGRVWNGEEGGGIMVLQPGQAIEWKVRLEIFATTNRSLITP